MLSLIYGTDSLKRAATRDATITLIKKKFPELEVTFLDALDKSREEIEALVYATNLFGAHRLVVVGNLSQHETSGSFFTELLKETSERADLTLLALEEKLTKDILTKYEKFAEKVTHCELPKEKAGEKRNPFALSDALFARDRKLSWKLYREAIDAGGSEEEIAGLMFWGFKSLVLAAKEPTAASAGLHPFVYGKAKRALLKWPEKELLAVTKALVTLVHENRSRGLDPELALEQFILTRI
jgi:DNA polymerase III delta subunit